MQYWKGVFFMASKYKRKDGTWAIKFQLPETGKKWHYAYSAKKTGLDDAQRAKTEKVLAQLEAEKEKEKDRFNPTLNAFFQTWTGQRELEGLVKGHTIYKETSVFNKRISPALGNKRLSEIKRQDVRNLKNSLITEGELTLASADYIIGLLSRIFVSALNYEDENGNLLLEYNPCTAITTNNSKGKGTRKEQHRDLVSGNDLDPFFEQAKLEEWQYYNFCLFGLYTGMRIGEVIALKVGAIDFEKAVVSVKQTFTRDEYGSATLGTPKTDESERIIPLCDKALEIAREQVKLRRELAGLSINYKDEFLFFNSKIHMVRPESVNGQIGKICKRANIPSFTYHAFRNTFTYKLQAVDAPASIIDGLLGHTGTSTTDRCYTHYNLENSRKWIKRAFNGPDTEQNTENAI